MTELFGVDLEKYANSRSLEKPIYNASIKDGMLNLERNIHKTDIYDVKLSEVIKFSSIEQKSLMNKIGYKSMMRYDQHLKRMKVKGFDRAMSTREFLAITVNMYRDDLYSPELEELVNDITKTQESEFLCDAVFTDNQNIYFYEGVNQVGYTRDIEEYSSPGGMDWYDKKHSFNVENLLLTSYDLNELNKKSPELVEFLFGLPYEKIPGKLRFGRDRLRISFDSHYELRPLSIGVGGRFNLDCPLVAGSRGVRDK